jgi:hypothetical protein
MMIRVYSIDVMMFMVFVSVSRFFFLVSLVSVNMSIPLGPLVVVV